MENTTSPIDEAERRPAEFRANSLLPLADSLQLLVGLSLSTAKELIRNGQINTVRLGHRHYVALSEITRLNGEH